MKTSLNKTNPIATTKNSSNSVKVKKYKSLSARKIQLSNKIQNLINIKKILNFKSICFH
jgi:hypothetical protein